MPKEIEDKLKRKARKKFGTAMSKRARRYIWGTLQKVTDWKPGRKPSREKD